MLYAREVFAIKKVFAIRFVWSYPERRPGESRRIRTDIAVLFVGDEAEKQALVLGEPEIFFTAPGYERWPLVMVRLARVDAGRLEELVTDAWRMRTADAPVTELREGDISIASHPYIMPRPTPARAGVMHATWLTRLG